MRTVLKKTLVLETKQYDFDNGLSYVEVWSNNRLKDCYFAEQDGLFPDGTIKKGYKKFFYSPYSGLEIEKEIKPVKYLHFEWFDKLYFFDDNGDIVRIDGKPAEEVDYQII